MEVSIARKTTTNASSSSSGSTASTKSRLLPATTKRKYGNRGSQSELGSKRQKVMGRPRNEWTPSRLRKLVRLYLMTNLGTVEIAKVLGANDFTPCKRDVQEQLRNILQTRPDKVRARGPLAKTRHRFLRECKGLRQERQSPTSHKDVIEHKSGQNTVENAGCINGTAPSIVESSKADVSRKFSHNTRKSAQDAQSGAAILSPDQLPLASDDAGNGPVSWLDLDFLPADINKWSENINSDPGVCPSPIAILSSPNAESVVIETRDCLPQSGIVPEDLVACQFGPAQAKGDIQPHSSDSPTPGSKFDFDFDFDSKATTSPYPASISDMGDKSSKASILSISSLRKRLSLRYSDSFLGDILSLMQNLTVAGSSSISTKGTTRNFRQALSTIVASEADTLEPLTSWNVSLSTDGTEKNTPGSHEFLHPVILPGELLMYCWMHINNNNELRICRHGPDQTLRGTNCPPSNPEPFGSLRSDVFDKIMTGTLSPAVIEDVDVFGNSGVHAAATYKPSKTLSLYASWSRGKRNAWMHKSNNAGESFLHLIKKPSATNYEDLSSLLQDLHIAGFNFNQRDHHGQTALHILTRPWVPREPLNLILDVLLSANICIPMSRDNLGYRIKDQLQQADCDPSIIQGLFAMESTPQHAGRYCLPNYGKNNVIETMEDLTLYARHAELLKDIRAALISPCYEDINGCNGLHCLAVVALNLPLREYPASPYTDSTTDTQREKYMDGLLKSGVDVNNHDKYGTTPLMAFIIHTRAGEDDAETTRLLQRLFDAGAGINTRDRQGATPLHLAVKLGRRAATKFLLCHGANVHARDSDGLGVIALGEAASKKAKHDEILYAQIILCVSLAVNAGGVSKPTILQEWGTPQYFD